MWCRTASLPLATSWLRPFLNEDPCGLTAAASLPCTFFPPAVGYVLPACCWLCSFLLRFSFPSTCCSWNWAAEMSALEVSAIRHRCCRRALDTARVVVARPSLLPRAFVWQPSGRLRTRRLVQADLHALRRGLVTVAVPSRGSKLIKPQLSWSLGCCASSSAPALLSRCNILQMRGVNQ